MNILFVTPRPPFPPRDGARLIVANLSRVLSAEHTLSLVCLTDEQAHNDEITRHFSNVRLVPHRPPPLWRKWARGMIDSVPVSIRAHESRVLRAELPEVARSADIDVAHFDTGLMAQYGDALPQIPRVVAVHDSMTRAAEQRTRRTAGRLERSAGRAQASKLERYEAAAYSGFSRAIVVTDSERAFLNALAPTLDVRVIPNGVDTDYFAPSRAASRPRSIGFLGVMDHPPNHEAALYFAQEILPHIWREIPDATFTVIGRNPKRALRALASDRRIQVTGEVADVRPHVAAQSIMVCPMRAAGGLKNKMLETMAMGKAVVATPEGVDGIDARGGSDFVLAGDSREFATACLRLLRDDLERVRLQEQARAWALPHAWSVAARQYVTIYHEAIAAHSRPVRVGGGH